MNLRPYQQEVKQRARDAWHSGHKNVLVVMPTGAGKTRLFANEIHDTEGACVAIAHRQELVGQIALALSAEEVRFRVIGPKNVIKEIVQTEMEELGRSYYHPNAQCATAGVDTLVSWSKPTSPHYHELMAWAPRVRKWVQDEAHHLLKANKWGQAIELFPNAIGLGVTATPERADGRGLGRHHDGVFDTMVVGPGMRDLINGLPDWEGNKTRYLTEYRIIVYQSKDFNIDAVDTGADGDYIRKQLAMQTRDSSVMGDVIDGYLRFARGKLGVTFAPDVETASELAVRFQQAGVPAEVLSAKTPGRIRREVLRRFRRREILQLVNVDLFGEGFDLPAIEVVSMARATQSYALYAQQFGRALRLLEGKERACIAEGQLVLTDRGLVPIEQVRLSDKLWDGVEWVEHGGRIYKGKKEVITYDGLTATEDHLVKTPEGWTPFGRCAREQMGIVKTGSGRTAIRECDNSLSRNSQGDTRRGIEGSGSLPLRDVPKRILGLLHQPQRWSDQRLPRLQSAHTGASLALRAHAERGTKMHQPEKFHVANLRAKGYPVQVQHSVGSGLVGSGAFRAAQRPSNRPGRQQWSLRTWESPMVHSGTKHVAHYSVKVVGKNPLFQGKVSSCSIRGFNTQEAGGHLDRGRDSGAVAPVLVQAERRVWDILNAGPRNCFTVSGLLVHNCIIDHVGNVIRHNGPPDRPRVWTLDRRERKAKQDDDGTVPWRHCLNPECMAPYERTEPACPYCGWVPVPADRSTVEFVDGDPYELDDTVLAAMRGEIESVWEHPDAVRSRLQNAGQPYMNAKHVANLHAERLNSLQALRDAIAFWAGHRRAVGQPDKKSYREFYYKFGVDVFTAQTLKRAEAEALTQRVHADIQRGVGV